MKIGDSIKLWFNSPDKLMIDVGSIQQIHEDEDIGRIIEYVSYKDGKVRVCMESEVISNNMEGLGD